MVAAPTLGQRIERGSNDFLLDRLRVPLSHSGEERHRFHATGSDAV